MGTTEPFAVLVDDGVPLDKTDVDIFAEKLRAYLEEKMEGFMVTSVSFLLSDGFPAFRAFVKAEKHTDGTVTDVFESIGGPEVHLAVNGFTIATWMLGCDRLSGHTLRRDFEDVAHVAMLALFGTWEFHNKVICCTKWGDDKGSTIECCNAP